MAYDFNAKAGKWVKIFCVLAFAWAKLAGDGF